MTRYPGCVVSTGGRADPGRGKSGGLPTVWVYAPVRQVFGVAATPNAGIRNTDPGSKDAGQSDDHSVLRTATPNDRNTESATPNADPAP